MKTIAQLSQAIGPTFLVGINALFAQIIFFELEDFFGVFRTTIMADNSLVALLSCLAPDSTASSKVDPFDASQYEQQLTKILSSLNTKFLTKFLAWIVDVGRIQLLRNELTLELNQMCRVNSQQLENSLETCNRLLLSSITTMKLNVFQIYLFKFRTAHSSKNWKFVRILQILKLCLLLIC